MIQRQRIHEYTFKVFLGDALRAVGNHTEYATSFKKAEEQAQRWGEGLAVSRVRLVFFRKRTIFVQREE